LTDAPPAKEHPARVTSHASGLVAILLGVGFVTVPSAAGAVSFGSATSYAAGTAPAGIAAGDLSGRKAKR